MKVCVVGAGYVGLVTGVCLAEIGHQVVCVDKDAEKIRRINRGETPIFEAGLADLLRRNVGSRLWASHDVAGAVAESDVSFIAVGTPSNGEGIDLRQVAAAAEEIGDALRSRDGYHVVTVKSTVVPGTTDGLVGPALERRSGKTLGADFGIAMNPEFLREGQAVEDFLRPDRIVIGGNDERAAQRMEEVYSVFDGVDRVRTTIKTAEMIKYASNALLATLISFANEIGNLCESIGGVDAVDVMDGVRLDRRISPILSDGTRLTPGFASYLEAGCGFGGSCFPKDVRALVAHGVGMGNEMDLLDAVMRVNGRQPSRIVSRLRRSIPDLRGRKVTVLGLAFKPGTDDMRESPAIPVVRELVSHGAKVSAFDPAAVSEARKIFANEPLDYPGNLRDAVTGASAVVLITSWNEFRTLPEVLKSFEPQPVVIDGRRILAADSVKRYEGVGLRRT